MYVEIVTVHGRDSFVRGCVGVDDVRCASHPGFICHSVGNASGFQISLRDLWKAICEVDIRHKIRVLL